MDQAQSQTRENIKWREQCAIYKICWILPGFRADFTEFTIRVIRGSRCSPNMRFLSSRATRGFPDLTLWNRTFPQLGFQPFVLMGRFLVSSSPESEGRFKDRKKGSDRETCTGSDTLSSINP